jgi:hypothetical protein
MSMSKKRPARSRGAALGRAHEGEHVAPVRGLAFVRDLMNSSSLLGKKA